MSDELQEVPQQAGMTDDDVRQMMGLSRMRNWPCYWGPSTAMGAGLGAPLIHSKIREIRRAVGHLEAKVAGGYGPQYPVKSARELMGKLCVALDDANVLVYPVKHDFVPLENVYQKFDKNAKALVNKTGTAGFMTVTLRFAAEDGSFIDVVGSGHGVDPDDKAGGKVSTYAWKDAILKALTLPEEDVLDTDNDSGQGGASIKRGRKAKTETESEPDPNHLGDEIVLLTNKITACASLDELAKLRADVLEKLGSDDVKMALSPVYKTRKLELTPQVIKPEDGSTLVFRPKPDGSE